MHFSAIIVFAVIWGGLMFYFLTPFERNKHRNKKDNSFGNAFKTSLLSGMKHKKVILAFVMLISTVICIWLYYAQLDWHNAAHGGGEMTFNPTIQSYILHCSHHNIYGYVVFVIGIQKGEGSWLI